MSLDRSEGRRLYGRNPSRYDAGRPDYPSQLYRLLETRCRLRAGSQVLEVGPGTGRVTRWLVGAGAQVTAVEPDRDMAAWLVDSLPRRDVQVIVAPLEDADVAPSGFDVAVAATSFHWVHPASGLHKLRRALRPGSWLAIWWMLFEDPSAPDEFDGAAQAVLGGSPSASEPGRPPFQLDEPARLDELRRAGFVQATSDILRSRHQLNPAQIVALYSTMAILLRRPHDEQVKLLDALEGLVANQFEGEVTRTFVTALYTARAPSASGA